MKNWLDSIYQHADPNIVKTLVGNKIDLEDQRQVSHEEAVELARQNNMEYFETSAKLDKNVREVINHMMTKVYDKMFLQAASNSSAADTSTR